MTDIDTPSDDDFEMYLCFSAVFRQKLNTAIESLDELDADDEPEYIRTIVSKVMKPLSDLAEYKIRKYPYTLKNAKTIVQFCGDKKTAESFVDEQYQMFEEYYSLLPVLRPKEECDKLWAEIDTEFNLMRIEIIK
ncbi:MAG TPA: hypothetical protein O0X42_05500 [Methanocorpusculum sp.]|nr:hypothetical protein [Methanocorpusculum sp.]